MQKMTFDLFDNILNPDTFFNKDKTDDTFDPIGNVDEGVD